MSPWRASSSPTSRRRSPPLQLTSRDYHGSLRSSGRERVVSRGMDDLTLDRLIADTLVEDYGWDEEEAEEAVAAWRDSGADGGWDAAAIAESIDRAAEDED
jgi:hypothetical protein